jgi:hypothetical protein
MKRLTAYLHVGEPSDAARGWLYEQDPRKAAAAILDHVPVVVPSDAHADLTLQALGVTRDQLHRADPAGDLFPDE